MTKVNRAQLLAHVPNVVGQKKFSDRVLPYWNAYLRGLNPPGRPAGVFYLLGPTGTGKTHSVESIAEAIHGSRKNILRVDCGEFQLEHEVAKLIGAPPGYLGHRETQPVLTQMKLNQAMSDRANLAIVLFDEIEKAAPSMRRLLLGILDRGTLRLGDNSNVSFERTFIFFTSNVGAEEASKNQVGLGRFGDKATDETYIAAARREFAPEFINRVDEFVVYERFNQKMLLEIVQREVAAWETRIGMSSSGAEGFSLDVSDAAAERIIELADTKSFGARDIRRLVQRRIIFPMISSPEFDDAIAGGDCRVGVIYRNDEFQIVFPAARPRARRKAAE